MCIRDRAEAYRAIWTQDGSPLIDLSRRLRDALQPLVPVPVALAMRYGNPDMESAYDSLLEQVPDLEEVIALPLYPHYAMSSYETAVEHARNIHRKRNFAFNLTFIKPYFQDPYYLEALSEHIRPFLQQPFDHILFSYHGIPERHIRKSDITGNHCLQSAACCETPSPAHAYCYRHQVFSTTRGVVAKLGIPEQQYSISFQSRLGKGWLEPFTDIRLEQMPGEGIRKLLVVCPAFVSDCLETLEEIEIRGKESFLGAGGQSFTMIPCLNTDPAWVRAIAHWLTDLLSGKRDMLLPDKHVTGIGS